MYYVAQLDDFEDQARDMAEEDYWRGYCGECDGTCTGEHRSEPDEPQCPDVCPLCGSDLRADGYPLGHQDADTGNPCPLVWA